MDNTSKEDNAITISESKSDVKVKQTPKTLELLCCRECLNSMEDPFICQNCSNTYCEECYQIHILNQTEKCSHFYDHLLRGGDGLKDDRNLGGLGGQIRGKKEGRMLIGDGVKMTEGEEWGEEILNRGENEYIGITMSPFFTGNNRTLMNSPQVSSDRAHEETFEKITVVNINPTIEESDIQTNMDEIERISEVNPEESKNIEDNQDFSLIEDLRILEDTDGGKNKENSIKYQDLEKKSKNKMSTKSCIYCNTQLPISDLHEHEIGCRGDAKTTLAGEGTDVYQETEGSFVPMILGVTSIDIQNNTQNPDESKETNNLSMSSSTSNHLVKCGMRDCKWDGTSQHLFDHWKICHYNKSRIMNYYLIGGLSTTIFILFIIFSLYMDEINSQITLKKSKININDYLNQIQHKSDAILLLKSRVSNLQDYYTRDKYISEYRIRQGFLQERSDEREFHIYKKVNKYTEYYDPNDKIVPYNYKYEKYLINNMNKEIFTNKIQNMQNNIALLGNQNRYLKSVIDILMKEKSNVIVGLSRINEVYQQAQKNMKLQLIQKESANLRLFQKNSSDNIESKKVKTRINNEEIKENIYLKTIESYKSKIDNLNYRLNSLKIEHESTIEIRNILKNTYIICKSEQKKDKKILKTFHSTKIIENRGIYSQDRNIIEYLKDIPTLHRDFLANSEQREVILSNILISVKEERDSLSIKLTEMNKVLMGVENSKSILNMKHLEIHQNKDLNQYILDKSNLLLNIKLSKAERFTPYPRQFIIWQDTKWNRHIKQIEQLDENLSRVKDSQSELEITPTQISIGEGDIYYMKYYLSGIPGGKYLLVDLHTLAPRDYNLISTDNVEIRGCTKIDRNTAACCRINGEIYSNNLQTNDIDMIYDLEKEIKVCKGISGYKIAIGDGVKSYVLDINTNTLEESGEGPPEGEQYMIGEAKLGVVITAQTKYLLVFNYISGNTIIGHYPQLTVSSTEWTNRDYQAIIPVHHRPGGFALGGHNSELFDAIIEIWYLDESDNPNYQYFRDINQNCAIRHIKELVQGRTIVYGGSCTLVCIWNYFDDANLQQCWSSGGGEEVNDILISPFGY